MSEEIKNIKIIRRVHVFYCDGCGKKLMESTECDDGYYETPKCVNEDIYVHLTGKRYFYETGFICDDCMEKERRKFSEKLLSIGFKEEN